MKGEKVIVRAFGGRPLVRRVWESDSSTVYIVNESAYQRLMADEDVAPPIGFPRRDVFRYDEKSLALINSGFKNPSVWDQLTHWNGTSA